MNSDYVYNLLNKNLNKIEEQVFRSDFYFNESLLTPSFTQESVVFKNCTFVNFEFGLLESKSLKRVIFFNCIFSGKLEISKTQDITFSFYKKGFIKALDIYDCLNTVFNFNESILDNVEFINLKSCKVKVFNSRFQNITFNGCLDTSIDLGGDLNRANKLILCSSQIVSFKISAGMIELLEVYQNDIRWFEIIGKNSTIDFNSFELYNSNVKTVEITKVNINSLFKIKSVEIENGLTISNSIFNKEVSFVNQDFSKCSFYNSNLRNSSLSFEGSSLLGGTFSAIQWPCEYKLASDNIKSGLNDRSLSEQYRQLKLVSAKRGDKIASLNFYANEMEKILSITNGDKSLNFWDKLLLITNKHFSNFGLSYTKPFLWLISVHTLLFTLIILAGYNDLILVWPWNNNLEGIVVSLGQYVYLLNPLHKLPESSNGWILLIDFFMRLINAYFIYYFLKATRKFS